MIGWLLCVCDIHKLFDNFLVWLEKMINLVISSVEWCLDKVGGDDTLALDEDVAPDVAVVA